MPAAGSIRSCYYTMCGECYYQMGQNARALDQYTAALKLYTAYYDWMLRVQFPAVIPPGGVGAGRGALGDHAAANAGGPIPAQFNTLQGQINNNAVVQQGGVVQAPMLVPIGAAEIVRTTTLAMRRRRELMGPVCKFDPLTNDLVKVLTARPAPPNNWSQAWIDVQLGSAYASTGNLAQAAQLLERSLVVLGELDHPLTATGLLELGQIALQVGDLPTASRYFEEATYAAATYLDPLILEEAFRWGALVAFAGQSAGHLPAPGTGHRLGSGPRTGGAAGLALDADGGKFRRAGTDAPGRRFDRRRRARSSAAARWPTARSGPA